MLHKLLSFNSLDDIVQFYCSNISQQMSFFTAAKLAVLGYSNHYQLTSDLASEFLDTFINAAESERSINFRPPQFIVESHDTINVDELYDDIQPNSHVAPLDSNPINIDGESMNFDHLMDYSVNEGESVINLDDYPRLFSPPIQHPAAESMDLIGLDEIGSSGCDELRRSNRMAALNADAIRKASEY